jgi:hypothetical protein
VPARFEHPDFKPPRMVFKGGLYVPEDAYAREKTYLFEGGPEDGSFAALLAFLWEDWEAVDALLGRLGLPKGEDAWAALYVELVSAYELPAPDFGGHPPQWLSPPSWQVLAQAVWRGLREVPRDPFLEQSRRLSEKQIEEFFLLGDVLNHPPQNIARYLGEWMTHRQIAREEADRVLQERVDSLVQRLSPLQSTIYEKLRERGESILAGNFSVKATKLAPIISEKVGHRVTARQVSVEMSRIRGKALLAKG